MLSESISVMCKVFDGIITSTNCNLQCRLGTSASVSYIYVLFAVYQLGHM